MEGVLSTGLWEVIFEKKLLSFGHCPKGGGGGSNPIPKVLGHVTLEM